MGESVVRLLSRNGVTSIDTTAHPTAKSKQKKQQQARKRRRMQQSAHGDHADSDDGEHDRAAAEDAALYDAAQTQLFEEMAAAGLEGSLPMSFGSSKRQQSTSRHKKRQRVHAVDAQQQQQHQEQQTYQQPRCDQSCDAKSSAAPADRPEKLAKVHVKFDSDGEEMERVVEEVADPMASVSGDLDAKESPCEALEATTAAAPPAAETSSAPSAVTLAEPPVDPAVLKFWKQRHHLFYKYDDGIQLDFESWYSVTPQAIAEHIASRLACYDVVVDPFSGCGGNIIQLARVCKHVIAIEIDPLKVRMAQHNARIYGVSDKIEWIIGDATTVLPRIHADAVFLSPPWGGLTYSRDAFQLDDMCISGVSGTALFALAQRVSKNIAYYLPKTTPAAALEALAPTETVECERIFLNKQLKVVTAYYGDLAAAPAAAMSAAEPALPSSVTAAEEQQASSCDTEADAAHIDDP